MKLTCDKFQYLKSKVPFYIYWHNEILEITDLSRRYITIYNNKIKITRYMFDNMFYTFEDAEYYKKCELMKDIKNNFNYFQSKYFEMLKFIEENPELVVL